MEKFTKLPNPATLPVGMATGCTFTSDGIYLAVAHNGVPYITIYKRDGDTFTKLSNPATLPPPYPYGCTFSIDGTYLAVGSSSSPYIIIYKRNGDIFTKLSNPTILPKRTVMSCAFTADSLYLAIGHDDSPYVTIYKRNGDTFEKLSNPAVLPRGTGYGCAFTSDGQYLAVVYNGAPYITIYKRDGDTFTKLSDPDIQLPGTGYGCAFTSDGQYLAVAHNGVPYITIYKRDGDTFIKLLDPVGLPTGYGRGCAFTSDGQYLAVAHNEVPYITIYKRDGDTFIKLLDPVDLPTGYGRGCTFTSNGLYLAIAHANSPYVTIYKKGSQLITGSITFCGNSTATFGKPIKTITGSITFQGLASMFLSAIKTAVGKITFRGGSTMELIGLVLRELEGVYQISSSEIISRNQPVLSTDLANYVEVWINPRVPADQAEEVYRSKEPEPIPPGGSKTFSLKLDKGPVIEAVASLEEAGANLSITDTKFYSGSAEITVTNTGTTEQTCIIVVQARPLELQGRRKIVVKDEESILDHGLVKYTFDSPLVQDEVSARDIGKKILWLFSVARANIEIEWRGDPALELADIVQIPEFEKLGVAKKENFYITQQLLEIVEGGLDATLSGRKIPRLKEGD